MSGGTRHTYKQELIRNITHMFRRSSLAPLPESCLTDMSTKSLAAFQEWVEPLIKGHPSVVPPARRLSAPKKGKESTEDDS